MEYALLSSSLNIKKVSEEAQKGVFEIEGLYAGYGLTVGNALRRALLSSLPGAAVTYVKIKNAENYYILHSSRKRRINKMNPPPGDLSGIYPMIAIIIIIIAITISDMIEDKIKQNKIKKQNAWRKNIYNFPKHK